MSYLNTHFVHHEIQDVAIHWKYCIPVTGRSLKPFRLTSYDDFITWKRFLHYRSLSLVVSFWKGLQRLQRVFMFTFLIHLLSDGLFIHHYNVIHPVSLVSKISIEIHWVHVPYSVVTNEMILSVIPKDSIHNTSATIWLNVNKYLRHNMVSLGPNDLKPDGNTCPHVRENTEPNVMLLKATGLIWYTDTIALFLCNILAWDTDICWSVIYLREPYRCMII